jgi:signal recognition particle subunit SRP54
MFDTLSDKLHDVFRKLRGESTLTEQNIAEAMQEIRIALLEADVNLQIATEFIESIKTSCIGVNVIKSVTPAQQFVKIVNDELVKLLGSDVSELNPGKAKPRVIMLCGLHGSGKTTTSGKLAKHLKKKGEKVLLVAADVYRPAAIDQLEFLANEVGVAIHAERTSVNVTAIVQHAMDDARQNNIDTVIIDTAGRLQIDETMIQELVRIKSIANPDDILLVADAALGQEAISVAEHFHNALTLTGFILTKLDGDARGGAALSIRKVTNVPVKFTGIGENLGNLEVFYPERMASRILGMGDVVSLVEKAANEMDENEANKLINRIVNNQYDFNDFLSQLKMLSKLGGLEGLLKYLPGGRQLGDAFSAVDPKHFDNVKAIILSMTPKERKNPDILDMSRRKRIAKGAGVTVEAVSNLCNQFNTLRKAMKSSGPLGRLLANPSMLEKPVSGGFNSMHSLSSLMSAPKPISKKAKEAKKNAAKAAKKARQKQRKK